VSAVQYGRTSALASCTPGVAKCPPIPTDSVAQFNGSGVGPWMSKVAARRARIRQHRRGAEARDRRPRHRAVPGAGAGRRSCWGEQAADFVSVNRLDTLASDPRLHEGLTGKDLLRLLRKRGCVELRQKGSHVVVQCDKCQTVVPVHAGEDLGPGLLRAIERDLEPCLGKGWLRPHRS